MLCVAATSCYLRRNRHLSGTFIALFVFSYVDSIVGAAISVYSRNKIRVWVVHLFLKLGVRQIRRVLVNVWGKFLNYIGFSPVLRALEQRVNYPGVLAC
jgi:hypothetical protein